MKQLRLATPAIFVSIFLGCSSPPPPSPTEASRAKTDYAAELASIQESLRKSITDEGQVRLALQQLNVVLADTDRQPKPLAADALSQLKSTFGLSDTESAELNKPAFSPLDTHYVYECIIFRDIARALQLTGDAKAKAEAAMQWVVEHVRYEERPGMPDPPIFVLNRGSGTGVERMYVFAALAQQLGLHVDLLGDPDASADVTHLWAAAVSDDAGTFVVDPRIGISFGQLPKSGKLDASPFTPRVEAWKSTGYDITPKRLEGHANYSPWSLSSRSPRMRLLEELVGKIQLSQEGTRAGKTTRWASGAQGTPLRVLAEAYPPEEGGTDQKPPGQRRIDRAQSEMVPWSAMPKELLQVPSGISMRLQNLFGETVLMTAKPGLAQTLKEQQQFSEAVRGAVREIGDAKTRAEMLQTAEQQFRPSFREDAGPTIRQLVMRGHYEEATAALVALSEGLRTLRGRSDGAASANAAFEWAGKVGPAYAEYLRAQRSQDPQLMNNARAAMEKLFQEGQATETYMRWIAAGHALADVTYLTALCKLDQAEARWRKSPDSEPTKASARTAQQIWDQFANENADSPMAGHAMRMRARAQVLAGALKPAAESYKKAADKLDGLEKAACLILADELAQR